jgi:hypothetical protein
LVLASVLSLFQMHNQFYILVSPFSCLFSFHDTLKWSFEQVGIKCQTRAVHRLAVTFVAALWSICRAISNHYHTNPICPFIIDRKTNYIFLLSIEYKAILRSIIFFVVNQQAGFIMDEKPCMAHFSDSYLWINLLNFLAD